MIRRTARGLAVLGMLASASLARAQERPPLLPEPVIAALAAEISGERAHRTVTAISLHHRTRGSRPLREAADWIVLRAGEAGLTDARVEQLPADGTIFYGTQRSRPPWDAEFAELWEMRRDGSGWAPVVRLASWEAQPMTLAQDSESGEVTAQLVYVGAGSAESDYAGKDVRGKLVLTSSQPGTVARLAVGQRGAAGIVSYAQNQRTAWWGEDESLIRWGHLDTFDAPPTFAFMISPGMAASYRDRLARDEPITLRAVVRAGKRRGSYDIGTATIPGADPRLSQEEIVFSCHLDHPRPGANDNASGCAAILEVGRALSKLIAEQRIPRPTRTIRFIWPPEIEGTIAILNAKPEWARRMKAAIHMDMVGGAPATKAIFHVTSGPASLPSFVYDVGRAFGAFVNEQSAQYAARGTASYPLVSAEGGKEPLLAEMADFSMGSDHQVYTEGSWRIPAIYLNDWPDRYIHTTGDTPANIDPTKLKRAAFIGAASAYFLATMTAQHLDDVQRVVEAGALSRAAATLRRLGAVPAGERNNLMRFRSGYERAVAASVDGFAQRTPAQRQSMERFAASIDGMLGGVRAEPGRATGAGAVVYRRNDRVRGPMSGFGYEYLSDKLGQERAAALRLAAHRGLWGSGAEYSYEVLNLVDGRRTAAEIRDAVSAIYGPVPLEPVVEYLEALEAIGVLRKGA